MHPGGTGILGIFHKDPERIMIGIITPGVFPGDIELDLYGLL
jgi:hypothetical protein